MKITNQFICLMLLCTSCISSKKIPQTVIHSSGWSEQVQETCSLAWEYAQLSLNAYNDSDSLNISNLYKKLETYSNSKIDFNAELLLKIKDSTYVLAFRGTDSKKDFTSGNNPFNRKQNEYGLLIFDSIREKYGENINIVVCGHSLGGAISINISINRSNLTCFSFNGSPIFKKKNKLKIVNERYSIVEKGEVLKITRIFGREADQLYTSINCSNKINPISQHSMLNLATCITQIAAIKSNEARLSLELNDIDDCYNSKGDSEGPLLQEQQKFEK